MGSTALEEETGTKTSHTHDDLQVVTSVDKRNVPREMRTHSQEKDFTSCASIKERFFKEITIQPKGTAYGKVSSGGKLKIQ